MALRKNRLIYPSAQVAAIVSVRESKETRNAKHMNQNAERNTRKATENDVKIKEGEDGEIEDEDYIEEDGQKEESGGDGSSTESGSETGEEDQDQVVQGEEGKIHPNVLDERYRQVNDL